MIPQPVAKKLLATSASRILLAPFLLALLSFGVVQADDQLNIVTVAGKDAEIGDGGPATSAQLNLPAAVAFDFSGNRYICEGTGHRVRKVNPAGIITTFAGTGGSGFNGDNIPATTAQLNAPRGVIVDFSGNLYIVETAVTPSAESASRLESSPQLSGLVSRAPRAITVRRQRRSSTRPVSPSLTPRGTFTSARSTAIASERSFPGPTGLLTALPMKSSRPLPGLASRAS
jgi:hypothetical protein